MEPKSISRETTFERDEAGFRFPYDAVHVDFVLKAAWFLQARASRLECCSKWAHNNLLWIPTSAGKLMGLEWRPQLSVGNDVIDADHKHLIGIINRVEDSLVTKDFECLRNALDSLSRYSKAHFAAEETIARAVGYAHVSRLHESHLALMEKLDQMRQDIAQEWSPAMVESFTSLLRDWLVNHVIREDLLMKPFLTKWSPEFDPR